MRERLLLRQWKTACRAIESVRIIIYTIKKCTELLLFNMRSRFLMDTNYIILCYIWISLFKILGSIFDNLISFIFSRFNFLLIEEQNIQIFPNLTVQKCFKKIHKKDIIHLIFLKGSFQIKNVPQKKLTLARIPFQGSLFQCGLLWSQF